MYSRVRLLASFSRAKPDLLISELYCSILVDSKVTVVVCKLFVVSHINILV